MRAMEDLDELHEDKYGSPTPSFILTSLSSLPFSHTNTSRSVTTYNTLRALEQAYTDYSQRSLDALTEAHRVGAESQKKLKELIKEHDKMAKEHAKKAPSVKGLPGSIAKWKTK